MTDEIDKLEAELVHLKDLHTLSNARFRAIEKINTAPTDIDGISKLVTELSIKCEIQAEIIKFLKIKAKELEIAIFNIEKLGKQIAELTSKCEAQKESLAVKDRIIVNMANKKQV